MEITLIVKPHRLTGLGKRGRGTWLIAGQVYRLCKKMLETRLTAPEKGT